MTSAPSLPHPLFRVLYAALALALAAGWILADAVPAQAALNWGVESPGGGATVESSFTLTAYVESFRDDRVEAVRARLRRGDQQVGDVRNLERQSETDAGQPGVRRSTWSSPVGIDSFANGTYTVEVSAVNRIYPEGSRWEGHEIVLDAPPVAKLETVRVSDASAREVQVRWVRSSAPDMKRYVVQRAQGGGPFTDVHTAGAADPTEYTDKVPEDGEYVYRLKAVRAGADGGEREALSEPRGVKVTPESSGRPQGDGSGPLAPQERTDEPGAPPPPRRSGVTTTPRLASRNGAGGERNQSSAETPRVATAPPNANAEFQEQLDYGVELPEWEREVTERVASGTSADGGTLRIFDRADTQQSRLTGVAAGLVFVLGGLHIMRFLNW